MKQFAILGRVVLTDKIIDDGAVVVCDGIISDVGIRCDVKLPDKIIDTKGNLIAPGFVDIHCHAGGQHWAYEDPKQMAEYHLKHGTTSLLCTLYRDLGFENTIKAIERIKKVMQTEKNILGVHMEGPYLNPKYGAGEGISSIPNKAEYIEIINSGIIKQWTFSPEVENTDEFLLDIKAAGIVPAIGHSKASPKRVYEVCKNGVKIITHLTNATGVSVSPTRYIGTIEMSFDQAAMLCDNVYYEIICDKNGVHVRHDMIKLIIKTVGIGRIIGITDACTCSIDESDVNIINGELMGSKLTMQQVSQNFLNLGIGICDIFKITSYNPACAIGIDDITGSIEIGKRADLIITDELISRIELPEY